MKIHSEHVVFAMSKDNKPALKAQSGDKVTFEAMDCFSNTVKTEEDTVSTIDFDAVNPATGPLYVEGADPGDTLKVTIHSIDLTSDQGVMVAAPGLGQFADYIEKEETVICQVNGDTVNIKGLNVPLNKMVGVIGTAPKDEAVNTGTPGDHGGNLDTTLIAEGATLYLPVNVEGALLAMGDCHVAMGDGEVMGSGVEIPADITVTVDVLKDADFPLPFVENENVVATLASNESMEEATKQALLNMSTFIQTKTELNANQAGMLLSAAGNVKTGQIVNPKYTMRVELAKSILNNNK